MNCELPGTILHGYLDGELDAARAAEFESHLETCADCAAELEAQEALRSSLRRAELYEKTPATLRRNIVAATSGAKVRSISSRQVPWNWLAVAATILLLLAAGWRILPGLGRDNSQSVLAAQIVDAHLRSLQPGHLTDVLSTDQHTVKPWFTGKLDFAPPVEDFADEGFPLQGGRLDVLHGHTVAALVYGRRKHLISVFISPVSEPEKDAAPRFGSLQGYHWIAWQKNGMEFSAVSDVSPNDLDQLQHLLSK